jgi:hypothetical protein
LIQESIDPKIKSMPEPRVRSNEVERLLQRVLDYSRLTKREIARKAGLAPETLSRLGRRGTADFSTVSRLVRSSGMEIDVRPSTVTNPHQRLDARSLALHTLIAGKLAADPDLIDRKVLPNIERFRRIHSASGTEKLLAEWEVAAKGGVSALLRLCIDPSERGQQLRQASPLTGILTPQERRSVYDAYPA